MVIGTREIYFTQTLLNIMIKAKYGIFYCLLLFIYSDVVLID